MSRTRHHRNQKNAHLGHDYGSRYRCNKLYGQSYGKDGRDRANSERRIDDKSEVQSGLDEAGC